MRQFMGWLPGNKVGATRVLLTAHMDCVEPCEGIKVVKKDGKILSDGTTILGSDDKSGVVAIPGSSADAAGNKG